MYSLIILLLFASCVPNVGTNLRARPSAIGTAGVATVNPGMGRVLLDNPIILSQNSALGSDYNLNLLLSTVMISTTGSLQYGNYCANGVMCFQVEESALNPTVLTGTRWSFDSLTPQFLETNTYYHMQKIFDQFFQSMVTGHNLTTSGVPYETSLPSVLYYGQDLFPLSAYANCDVVDNSYYDRGSNHLCFGSVSNTNNRVKWAQDSTIIYHETGHYLQKLLFNLRNIAGGNPSRVDIGRTFYDESGAIGEGLSDYFSYYINGRTHFGEWAAGRFLQASRPLIESDPIHTMALSTTADGRLRYPDYLNYDPNAKDTPVEDIHIAGMIVSHYLVAFTQDLMNPSFCNFNQKMAADYTMHILSETLSELGDLNSVGVDGQTAGRINYNSAHAFEWASKVNPLNYRKFAQTFGKFVLLNINSGNLGCYTKAQSENLLDQYGLLLFNSYEENRNFSDPSLRPNTLVDSFSRTKSVLIAKANIGLDPTPNATTAFVVDNQASIQTGVTGMIRSGIITQNFSNTTPSDFTYNNSNGRVSPGEVVGIGLNLFNKSNSSLAGVQVLANDWDQTGNNNPANVMPICSVIFNDKTLGTQIISQKDFKLKAGIDQNLCLDPTSDGRDCFFRAIKGADQSYYSKIDPNLSWNATQSKGGKTNTLDWGNVVIFEVSKNTPPGTTFNCKFRVRASNCSDCYMDASRSEYDYLDQEYLGAKPFQVIELQIPVID